MRCVSMCMCLLTVAVADACVDYHPPINSRLDSSCNKRFNILPTLSVCLSIVDSPLKGFCVYVWSMEYGTH